MTTQLRIEEDVKLRQQQPASENRYCSSRLRRPLTELDKVTVAAIVVGSSRWLFPFSA